MKSKLIYKNGTKGVNSISGDFVGFKDLAYNNLMEVGFKPQGSGRVICKFDDFILLKLFDPAPEDVKIPEEVNIRIKMDEIIYADMIDEFAGQEKLEESRGLKGLFLTLKNCITYEIDLEKRILIVATSKYSYVFNYNYINTFIEENKISEIKKADSPASPTNHSKETTERKKTRRFRND